MEYWDWVGNTQKQHLKWRHKFLCKVLYSHIFGVLAYVCLCAFAGLYYYMHMYIHACVCMCACMLSEKCSCMRRTVRDEEEAWEKCERGSEWMSKWGNDIEVCMHVCDRETVAWKSCWDFSRVGEEAVNTPVRESKKELCNVLSVRAVLMRHVAMAVCRQILREHFLSWSKWESYHQKTYIFLYFSPQISIVLAFYLINF